MEMVVPILLIALIIFPELPISAAAADEAFDVRQHLSTVTRYGARKKTNIANASPSLPDGCRAVHLNLVARHGTRAPTKKRLKELDHLSTRLEDILNEAKQKADKNVQLEKVPAWLFGWQSPWKGSKHGGQLVDKGEDELYHLGLRVRERFTELFEDEYHPNIFSIRATQVPRASASAVAFGIGLFSGKGNLAAGRHRAFSVISESRASDLHLRFFDTCGTYKELKKRQEPAVEKIKEPVLDQITSSLINRYQLNFRRQDVASLWFLCKQEASLLEITNQACALFTASEVSLLEWTDDLEGFILKGYGESINYRMGVPLLQDVVHSMEQAIIANEENYDPGSFEKARLRFAHAETIVPFSCLLGLFLDESEFGMIQREQPLSIPPQPPKDRKWRGSIVAPFAGNIMLVLYHCSDANYTGSSYGYFKSKYFVQILHNEIPVALPGCGNKDFCNFEDFKEKIVEPHLKHDFNTVCKAPLLDAKIDTVKPCSVICWLSNLFGRLLTKRDTSANSGNQKSEL